MQVKQLCDLSPDEVGVIERVDTPEEVALALFRWAAALVQK